LMVQQLAFHVICWILWSWTLILLAQSAWSVVPLPFSYANLDCCLKHCVGCFSFFLALYAAPLVGCCRISATLVLVSFPSQHHGMLDHQGYSPESFLRSPAIVTGLGLKDPVGSKCYRLRHYLHFFSHDDVDWIVRFLWEDQLHWSI
jgi:hypothetical protein